MIASINGRPACCASSKRETPRYADSRPFEPRRPLTSRRIQRRVATLFGQAMETQNEKNDDHYGCADLRNVPLSGLVAREGSHAVIFNR
jgi:hypothetical protein